MRRNCFDPLANFAIGSLEKMTKSGTIPGLFQTKSTLKLYIQNPPATKLLTQENIVRHFYKGSFQPGIIRGELVRDTFQTFCVFVRVTSGPGQTPVGNVPVGGYAWQVDFGEQNMKDRQENSVRYAYAIHRSSETLEGYRKGAIDFNENVANAFETMDMAEYIKKADEGKLTSKDVTEVIGKMGANISKIAPDLAAMAPNGGAEMAKEFEAAAETVSKKVAEGKGLDEIVTEAVNDMKKAGIDINEALKEAMDGKSVEEAVIENLGSLGKSESGRENSGTAEIPAAAGIPTAVGIVEKKSSQSESEA